MASQQNFFALLDGDENEDLVAVVARVASPRLPDKAVPAAKKKLAPPPQPASQSQAPAKLPGKPLPPAQAVREAQQVQSERGRGRASRGGRGAGRGFFTNRQRDGFSDQIGGELFQGDRGNYNDRNYINNRDSNGGGRGGFYVGGGAVTSFGDSAAEDVAGGRSFEGGRGRGRWRGRGRGYAYNGDGEDGSRRREFDRNSGIPRGETGEGFPGEEPKVVVDSGEKMPEEEANTESANLEAKNVEEDNEMTFEEYEKLLADKRKGLEALKPELRTVTLDKDFESMQIMGRRHDDDVLLRLGGDNEKGKKKLPGEKEDKLRKSVSINEFLKPADGEDYYGAMGRRGRGRGRGDRGGYRGSFGVAYNNIRQSSVPHIEDPGQFPTLSGK